MQAYMVLSGKRQHMPIARLMGVEVFCRTMAAAMLQRMTIPAPAYRCGPGNSLPARIRCRPPSGLSVAAHYACWSHRLGQTHFTYRSSGLIRGGVSLAIPFEGDKETLDRNAPTFPFFSFFLTET